MKNLPAEQISGMLHFYRPYGGKIIHLPKEFLAEWKKASPERVEAVEQVYSGGNRLGNANNSLNIYRGFFVAPEKGTYVFHTASTDASFLLIDGKLVASYPGRNGVWKALYGDYKGKIDLEPGVHRFEYYHANSQWSYYAISAMSRPGAKRMNIIPKERFLPFLPVTRGAVRKGKDFSWKKTGTIDIDGRQMREVTTSDGRKFYFYSEGSIFIDGFEIPSGYDFAPRMLSDKQSVEMLRSAWDQAKKQAIEENGYRFLASALPMFKMQKEGAEFYRMILREGNLPPDLTFRFYRTVSMDRELEEEHYEDVAKELEKLMENNGDPARLEYARILFYFLDRRTEAARELKKIDPSSLTGEFQRMYRILEADMSLFEYGYDAALERYNRMDSMTKKMSSRQIIEADGAMVSLRNALITGNHRDATEYLERVERARPEVRLNPEVMFLKSRFLARQNRPRYAAYYAEAVLRMHPTPATAAAALLHLGEYYTGKGKYEIAREYFRRLGEEYPKSREALAAEKILRQENLK